jgi:hypothetical protein
MKSRQDTRLDFFKFCLASTRASSKVWYRYRINKSELWLLSVLYGALIFKGGNPVISKSHLFKQVTGNNFRKAMLEGYLRGCISKGFMLEYENTRRPGSYCLGISEVGFAALDYYIVASDAIIDTIQKEMLSRYSTKSLLLKPVPDDHYQVRQAA